MHSEKMNNDFGVAGRQGYKPRQQRMRYPSHQISERKNFKNATTVNAKAKNPSKNTSIAERRNVSDKVDSVSVGGGRISLFRIQKTHSSDSSSVKPVRVHRLKLR